MFQHKIYAFLKFAYKLINTILQGITALVTGGASGLGRGTVERFVKQGAKVVIADLPISKGKSVADELGETNAVFAPVDVRSNIYSLRVP